MDKIKVFFEENALAQQAAHSIKNGREIGLVIDGVPYTFKKDASKNRIESGKSSSPDLIFEIPKQAAEELFSNSFTSVGAVGIFIFEKMLASDPQHKVKARVHAGFLSLMTGGYLGVLAAGGAEVAKFLAQKGLSNPSKIKDAIAKLRS